MSNRKAFLSAIRETPEDDAPRLVFADWLEDNDDLARAEFIRAQVELARLRADDERAFDLRRREGELLARHQDEWRKEVPDWARRGCTFRRGFVDRVEATPKQLISGKTLSKTVPVRHATVNAEHESDVIDLAGCPHLARFTSLRFGGSLFAFTDDSITALARSEHVRGLRRLDFGVGMIRTKGVAALAASDCLRGLTRLRAALESDDGVPALLEGLPSLTGLRVTPDTRSQDGSALRRLLSSPRLNRLEELTVVADPSSSAPSLSPCERLRRLTFWSGAFPEAARATLATWPGLGQLEELGFVFVALDAGTVKRLTSAELPRIRSLRFSGAQLNGEAITALASSAQLSGLTTLESSSNRQDDDGGVLALAASDHLRSLTTLRLPWHDVTPRAARALGTSDALSGLRSLDLSRNHFGDEGVKQFTARLRMTNLDVLDLGGNNIADDGVVALAGCPALSNLRELKLSFEDGIGDRGAEAIANSPVLARLQRLDLRNTRIGEKGLLALANSPHLNDILSLSLIAVPGRLTKARSALKERFGDRVEF